MGRFLDDGRGGSGRRHVHFNSRMACPSGSEHSVWDPEAGARRCEAGSKFCCKKTKYEALKWDHEVRGRCWVLRPRKDDDDAEKVL